MGVENVNSSRILDLASMLWLCVLSWNMNTGYCFLPPTEVLGRLAYQSANTYPVKRSKICTILKIENKAVTDATTEATADKVSVAEDNDFINPSLVARSPREFEWWNDSCDAYLDQLDDAGGVRFVAFHDEKDGGKDDNTDGDDHVATNNWLHVTSSNPSRRAQYEMRYVEDTQMLAGVVRLGIDCEGPPGNVHGGATATVADAVTATTVFKASQKWGLTTNLNCNYREMMPLGTPVKVEAKIVDLKKRKASVEWTFSSLTEIDRKGNPVRHAFGTADFLLPR